jgi:hypothetical protein
VADGETPCINSSPGPARFSQCRAAMADSATKASKETAAMGNPRDGSRPPPGSDRRFCRNRPSLRRRAEIPPWSADRCDALRVSPRDAVTGEPTLEASTGHALDATIRSNSAASARGSPWSSALSASSTVPGVAKISSTRASAKWSMGSCRIVGLVNAVFLVFQPQFFNAASDFSPLALVFGFA